MSAAGVLAGTRLLAADDASFSKDLMATIALQGMRVRSIDRQQTKW